MEKLKATLSERLIEKMTISREKIKQLLDSGVLQAYAHGLAIEVYDKPTKSWIEIIGQASFDSPSVDYRIKPIPQYRPYTNTELSKLVGKVIKEKDFDLYYVVLYNCLASSKVKLSNDFWYSPNKLLEKFKYPDGTPIGVEIEK